MKTLCQQGCATVQLATACECDCGGEGAIAQCTGGPKLCTAVRYAAAEMGNASVHTVSKHRGLPAERPLAHPNPAARNTEPRFASSARLKLSVPMGQHAARPSAQTLEREG